MPLALLALLALAPSTVRLAPSDDVWVYPHASDPAKDSMLRIWGTSGHAAPVDATEAEELSMGYLKWDLSSLPGDKKLTKATLIVKNIPDPGFTPEQAKAAPLQARPVGAKFSEKDWTYEGLSALLPEREEKAVFGSASPDKWEKEKPVEIRIDLLKGPNDFRVYLRKAMDAPKHELALALTSAIDMASLGRSAIYKIYSRDERDAVVRPSLELEFD